MTATAARETGFRPMAPLQEAVQSLFAGAASKGPTIKFPLVCPKCGNELLAELAIPELAVALIENRPFHLYSACHNESWVASQVEAEQIQEYLQVVRPWIGDAQFESNR